MKGLSCCYDLSDMLKAKLHFIGHEFLQGIIIKECKTLMKGYSCAYHIFISSVSHLSSSLYSSFRGVYAAVCIALPHVLFGRQQRYVCSYLTCG